MPFYYTIHELGQNIQMMVFTLDFTCDEQKFYCLVRAKTLGHTIHYSLTLLDPDMEEVLAEPYILTQKERVLQMETPVEKNNNNNIKFASAIALRTYLEQNKSVDSLQARYTA